MAEIKDDFRAWQDFWTDFPEMAEAVEARERLVLTEVAKRHNAALREAVAQASQKQKSPIWIVIFSFIAGIILMIAFNIISQPSTYEDCIREGMKGVQSDRAATIIMRSCGSKFGR